MWHSFNSFYDTKNAIIYWFCSLFSKKNSNLKKQVFRRILHLLDSLFTKFIFPNLY